MPAMTDRPSSPLIEIGGSRRIIEPAATLARVEPHFERLGLTRLADVTGLDRIGIDVWLAIRPNARSLSGGQGKGATRAAAQASAVMETVESWHAERVEADDVASYQALGAAAISPRELDRGPHFGRWSATDDLAWVWGVDMFTGNGVAVPHQTVSLDLTIPGARPLRSSSNGLASGNDTHEARLHGLYELIERESERRWRSGSMEQMLDSVVDVDDVADRVPAAGALIDKMRSADCHVVMFDLTGPSRLATYQCIVADRVREFRPLVADGTGTHGLPEIALMRAITEAAQSRATLIAGSRDDKPRGIYAGARVRPSNDHPPPPAKRFDADVVPIRSDDLEAEICEVLERLTKLGVHRAAACDLATGELDVAVSRVVVPNYLLPAGPT